MEAALDLAAEAMRPLTLAQLQSVYDDAQRHARDGILEAIGVSFGEMLRHNNPLEWVLCEDENGSEPALRATVPGVELRIHPLSMLRHRIEDGEAVDLRSLNRDAVATLNRLVAELRPAG